MKIGCIWQADALSNAQYRAVRPMTALQRRGHEIAWCAPSTQEAPISLLHSCDLVHVYRTCTTRTVQMLRGLRNAGVAITWDNDDDITLLPKESPNYRMIGGLFGERDFALQVRGMRLADIVTTTSHGLAEKYRGRGVAHVKVIENYLPSEFLRGPRERHDGLVIGWLAAAEHIVDTKRMDFLTVVRDVLDANLNVRLVSVGLPMEFDHARYQRRQRVEFKDLANTMRGFDIGLAPLADIAFNRCRSSVKVKEYAAAGVAWLASPVGEYAGLGERQGGRLVPDGEWREAVEGLVRGGIERRYLASRGKRWARGQTIERNVGEWEDAFEEAIARARSRGGDSVRSQRVA